MPAARLLTLGLVTRPQEILLGLKKRGFGAGNWNGFGGKVEKGETIEAAAVRELREEAGLEADSLQQRGQLFFTFEHIPDVLEIHVFHVTKFAGEAQETEEMKPRWFPFSDIPYDTMWADDRYWLPLFLAGKSFTGSFHFADEKTILKSRLCLISSFIPVDV